LNSVIDEEVDSEDPTEESAEPQSEADDEILEEARKRYRQCVDADTDNRTAALADLMFLTGGTAQWDEKAVEARKADGRPMITVNTLPTYLHQVTNDQRQNTPSIKVHPVNDGADIDTAKVRQGMIRHIEYDSNADVATDRAVNSAAAVGFGYWRLVTDYESDTSFNQKIMYRSIRNALSVRMDPLSTEPDGSDQQFCFIEMAMARAEFKRQYPKAKATTSAMGEGYDNISGWLTDSTVVVCEYYRIKKTDAEVVQLSDGTSGYADELIPNGDEAKLPVNLTVINRRAGTKCKVEWFKITGIDVLERQEIKCKWIPVFPVYGDEVDIEGKVIRSGIIRNAKGPAQMYNVMITSATEEVSLRSKSPYMMAEGQDEGYEDMYAQANQRAWPAMYYKPVTIDGTLAPPPQRQPMADVPNGTLAMAMHARDNVKATTGLFDSSLGNKGNATSGIQEREQQHQGEVTNFHFTDNLLRSLRHCGRCIDYMIPHYYDAQRMVAIMNPDNSVEHAEINKPNAEGEKSTDGAVREVLNDMSGGEYTATVESGPNYTTMREESAQFFTKAIQAARDPKMAAVITYLAVKYQDVPGAEEAAEMLEKLLPPEVQKTDEEDGEVIQTPKGPLPVAQVPQVLAQLEAQLQQATEALQKADADGKSAEAMRQQNEQAKIQTAAKTAEVNGQLDFHRVQVEEENAKTARMRAETERAKAQSEADAKEAELLLAHAQLQVDAKAAEAIAANGDTSAFEAWKATLESNTRIMVAEIAARSAERRAVSSAMQKKPPADGAELVRPQA